MCAVDGFNLTKFICNRKNALMSIPDIRRSEGVKDTDLVRRSSLRKELWEYIKC